MEIIPFSVSNYTLESYLIKITSKSKAIYWIIIGMVILSIIILPFVYVDVSVQAKGYFQSEIENQIVYSPFQGKVVFSSISNGDKITTGDTLLIIDSETIRVQQAALILKIAANDRSINDLEKLLGLDSIDFQLADIVLVTKKYQAEYGTFKNTQTIQLQKYMKRKIEYERNLLLYNQNIIPEIEYENSLFLLNSEKDNLNQILLNQKSLWQSDLSVRRNEAVALLADFEQYIVALSNRIVLAPTSGEIIKSSDIQPGSIVGSGQNIAEISPDGELLATCFVKPSDIGLIYENQQVKIQVDAFNYHEWGMINGNIIDISDDMIVENGSSAYFRIKCKPSETFLSLKNGHKASIRKGMSLNARIIVIQRSLFNLLFDRADKWFNPYTNKRE